MSESKVKKRARNYGVCSLCEKENVSALHYSSSHEIRIMDHFYRNARVGGVVCRQAWCKKAFSSPHKAMKHLVDVHADKLPRMVVAQANQFGLPKEGGDSSERGFETRADIAVAEAQEVIRGVQDIPTALDLLEYATTKIKKLEKEVASMKDIASLSDELFAALSDESSAKDAKIAELNSENEKLIRSVRELSAQTQKLMNGVSITEEMRATYEEYRAR